MRLKANEVFLSFYKLPLLLPLLCRSFYYYYFDALPFGSSFYFILRYQRSFQSQDKTYACILKDTKMVKTEVPYTKWGGVHM